MNQRDLDILARTLYGEAESGDESDARAIACVVMNRTVYPNWPASPAEVCLQPWQFSCWNQNDPNRARILQVTVGDAWFRVCRDIAADAIEGRLRDETNGATHYYASWMKQPPKWARGHKPVHQTPWGRYNHLFFNDIDTPPPVSAAAALEAERPLSETRTVKASQVGTAGGLLGLLGTAVENMAPAFPFLQTAAQYAPWAIGIGILIAIGAFVAVTIARRNDRAQGLR